jgi:hypothetical protein
VRAWEPLRRWLLSASLSALCEPPRTQAPHHPTALCLHRRASQVRRPLSLSQVRTASLILSIGDEGLVLREEGRTHGLIS